MTTEEIKTEIQRLENKKSKVKTIKTKFSYVNKIMKLEKLLMIK